MLTYKRGVGWIEETVFKTYTAEHDGKSYRVTIYDHGLAKGENGRTIFNLHAKDGKLPDWYCEFEGIPAGFGGGDFGPTETTWKVVTEEIC